MSLAQQSAFQQHLQGQTVQLHTLDRQALEESLRRSITLVFWYKQHYDPIRLTQEIATFPLFQLSHFSQLVSDLGLNPACFVDCYNPISGHWEQHAVSTVRTVESEQRVLYRVRKSFLEGLLDDECPGLKEEIALQPRPLHQTVSYGSVLTPTTAVKRSAPDSIDESAHSAKYYRVDRVTFSPATVPNNDYVVPSADAQPYPSPSSSSNQAYPSPPPFPSPIVSKRATTDQIFAYTPTLKEPLQGSCVSGSGSPLVFPHHPHPPLKRWPNDYTVCEISEGFKQMDSMVTQQPTLTQKCAFEKVFGCRYVKSTVCRHRSVWRRADDGVKVAFESMGTDERAVWGNFVKQVEGRRKSGTAAVADNEDSEVPQRHAMMHDMRYAAGLQMIAARNMDVGGNLAQENVHPPDYQVNDVSITGGVELGNMSDVDEPVMGSLGPPPAGHIISDESVSVLQRQLGVPNSVINK
ncbi:hypothetical protein BJ322DRAFT_1074185 [Thelephora terrestris]|uniref:Uncharacterized protein n=1 Tax=Thelephora terrestris TaxID=56493 RepID=A0A9P6L4I4_9AGAM|nr:hypothetical protein BJ322DRAFT_1074185 [Thelephora terrestris]